MVLKIRGCYASKYSIVAQGINCHRNIDYLHIFINIGVQFQIVKYVGWVKISSNMCGTWRKVLLHWNLPLCALNVSPVMRWTLFKMANAISRLNLVDIFGVPLYSETAQLKGVLSHCYCAERYLTGLGTWQHGFSGATSGGAPVMRFWAFLHC